MRPRVLALALPLALPAACATPRAEERPVPEVPASAGLPAGPEADPAPAEPSTPDPAEVHAAALAPPESPEQRAARLDAAVLAELTTTWNVRSVRTHAGVLRIQTGMRVLDERVYRAMLPQVALALAHEGGVPAGLERIEVANRFGASGYVLEEPGLLASLLDLSPDRAERALAAATRPLDAP